MAEDSTNNAAGLQPDSDAVIPRIKLTESGVIGLKTVYHQIVEESNRAFRYPAFLKTVNEMKNDAVIATAFNTYRMFLSRVTWKVEPPEGATAEQKVRAQFIAQQMGDMENSWNSFISEVLTYLEYGFSIQEKVFRRRLRKNGSKYNDGLVGLRKLAPRGQDTIRNWVFSEDGRDLLAVEQTLMNLENGYRYIDLASMLTSPDGLISIPREKFLLFSADSTKGNPQGTSLLKGVYHTWKQLSLLKDQEILGIAKDAAGLPLIQIPPKYMDPNASPEDQAVYSMCKKIVDNLASGTQRGIIFPKMQDPETKADLFTVELLEKKVSTSASLDTVIKRYTDEILLALSVDVLRSSNTGSFSLNDGDTSILSIAMSHRLNEIADVLNNDLVKNLFALNGWTDEDLPKFVPSDICGVSLEEFSKWTQRVASVGLLEIDRPLLNKIREVGGIPPKPEDSPVDKENLTGATSRSGDGMKTGTGDGTSTDPFNKSDRSTSNADNKA